MKKVLLAATFVVAIFTGAIAQQGFKFGAGVKVALPVGAWANYYSVGLGGELQGEYNFSEKFSGVGSAGYIHFLGKDNIDGNGLVPVLAGVRYYPSANFFFGAKAGVALSTAKGGGSSFSYLPHIGYNTQNFQLAAGYEGWSNSGSSGAVSLTGIFKF